VSERRLDGVDEPLANVLPDTPRRAVTLGNLLSMTAGYGRALNFGPTDAASLANRPAVNPPGTTFLYDSGSTDLLAAALARATGMTAFQYAQRKLFAPLGIHDAWVRRAVRVSCCGREICSPSASFISTTAGGTAGRSCPLAGFALPPARTLPFHPIRA